MTLRVAGRPLLEEANAQVFEGHRVALVGRNGAGKSSLLKAIAEEMPYDQGQINMPTRWTLGMTRQETPSGRQSLLTMVLASDQERLDLLAEAEVCTEAQRLADIHERLEVIGASSAPARAARILAGLGFSEEAQSQPCDAFSGGWRMRVALASLLFRQPDLLLLDEPTNHLDLEAALWLEDYLRSYPGTLIIVSHDRGLLNRVPTDVIHLNNRRLKAYKGNFDQFQATRNQQLALDARAAAKQEKKRQHLQSFIDRFGAKAKKARQAQSRAKVLAKMTPIMLEHDEMAPRLHFADPGRLAPPLYAVEDLDLGYEDKPVLKNLALRLDSEDRVALLGANGNGKSTLIKFLAGRLEPMAGRVHKDGKIRVGYFAQHQTEELPMGLTAIEALQAREPALTPTECRAHLGSFSFSGERATTQIEKLSGGEKARLLFAFLNREQPHILLLDEPTNHLDMETREALITALNDFAGAVVLVSHDPDMIALTADQLWLVSDRTVQSFDGDLEDYRKLLQEEAKAAKKGQASGPDSADRSVSDLDQESGISAKERRQAAAALRSKLAPFNKKIQKIEKQIERANQEKAEIEAQMAQPAFYEKASAAEQTAKQIECANLDKLIAQHEEAWLEAQEALERAEVDS